MNNACPCPTGDKRTRQWLTRSAMVLPPSLERRMNEFSPVITTSCGSTIWGAVIGLLLICGQWVCRAGLIVFVYFFFVFPSVAFAWWYVQAPQRDCERQANQRCCQM